MDIYDSNINNIAIIKTNKKQCTFWKKNPKNAQPGLELAPFERPIVV